MTKIVVAKGQFSNARLAYAKRNEDGTYEMVDVGEVVTPLDFTPVKPVGEPIEEFVDGGEVYVAKPIEIPSVTVTFKLNDKQSRHLLRTMQPNWYERIWNWLLKQRHGRN